MNYDYKFVIHTYDFPLILIWAILCKVKKVYKVLTTNVYYTSNKI